MTATINKFMAGLSLSTVLFFTSNALAQVVPFVYDNHGKNDPFFPLVTVTGAVITYDPADMNVGDLILEGIVADKTGMNAAIINGKIVSAGDAVGSYVIESVGIDEVNLIQGDQKSVLKLKKGGL